MVEVKLADDARVAALVKATLADIKTDSFIGIAGILRRRQHQGLLDHMFLPAQRGVVPDRHDRGTAANSTMTNAMSRTWSPAKTAMC